MISSPSVIFPSAISVVVKLTGEFTSLEEPLMIPTLALSWIRLPMDLVSPDLKGESNLKIRRESLDF
jgi:hypothetical protein